MGPGPSFIMASDTHQLDFFSQGSKHIMQAFLVDESVPVLVDHVEGLLELLNLGLVKHGEHVGGRVLGALLGGLCLCSFARHGGS